MVLAMGEQARRADRRIGDRERDAAVAVLQQAVSDGRLSVDELDGRLAIAIRARTYAELEPVITDLTDGTSALELSGSGSMIRRPASPGYSAEDPLLLDGAVKRLGPWRVPPFIRIDNASRWAKLDFQLASTDSTVIDIELVGGAGWVLLILPAGWAADLDRLSVGWGSTSVKVPHEPAAGKPLLLIHGAVGAGRLSLRTPKPRDHRRAERKRLNSA